MSAESVGQIGLDLVVNQNQFDRQMRGITNIASKAGKVLAGAFAIKKITEFTSACLDLGSDLAEVQNVVDVAFSKMNEQVNNFAQNAVFQFGLSETMAKKYTGTFGAMAKAFGFAENEAYAMSTTLTGLAGDVASFYNITQDEAYTKLKSVFSGETETLKDLGIVMTQTALDQYALANGYGKTTSAMTEQEKVALRYAFVQQQLALAQGDFARTSDSWANQVRILKLQFDSLRASLGQGFIAALTPVIKVINTVMGKLVQLANVFSAFMKRLFGVKSDSSSGIGAVTSDVSSATTAMDNLSNSTSGVGSAAKKAAKERKGLMGIDEINTISSTGSDSDSGSGSGGSSGIGDIGMGDLDFSQQEDAMDGMLSKAEEFADKVKNFFGQIRDFIVKNKDVIISALAGIAAAFTTYFVISNWSQIIGGITGAFSGLAGAIGSISLPILGISALIGLLVGNIVYLWRTNEQFRNSVIEVWNNIKDFINTVITDIGSILTNLWNKYGQTLLNNLKGFMKSIQDLIVAVWENIIKPIIENALEMLTWLWNDHLKGLVEELGEFIMKLTNGALEIWNKFISPIVDFLVKTLGPIFVTVFNYIVDSIGTAIATISDIVKSLLKVFGGIIDFLVGVFTGNWSKAWEGVRNIFKGIFEGLVSIAKWPLNLIIDMVNAAISGINTMIKTINKVPGVNISTVPKIPKLAKGGIIDSPTIAMVGEAGKEAVMPLENNTGWITDLASKVADRMPRYGGSSNDNSMSGDLILQIDGSIIGKVALNQLKKMQRQGGISLIPV